VKKNSVPFQTVSLPGGLDVGTGGGGDGGRGFRVVTGSVGVDD
jgi:hypothetical protein